MPTGTKRAAIYARVSTANGQTCENQIHALQLVAQRHGWEVVEIFEDNAISGAKGRDQASRSHAPRRHQDDNRVG